MLKFDKSYKGFIIEFSKKYSDIEFHFTAINGFANNFPEVATVINSDITEDKIFAIELDYDEQLDYVVSRNNIDTRLYDGICFVTEDKFDTDWYTNDHPYFRVKNGEFTDLHKIK